jgi:hypothetical protein
LKGGNASILGLSKCAPLDWGLFGILQAICLIYIGIGYYIVSNELKWREEVGYDLVEGELELTGKGLCTVCTVAWLGAFAAAFSGTGPGAIFCPAIILIGVNP